MGQNWAIAVGINVYDNLLPLKYAKADAEAMATWLKEEAKFNRVFLFSEDSPAIREANPPIPTSPTYGHIRRFLRAQFENIEQPLLKPEDNLWFFFAGHGRRSGDKDYLMLSDSDPGDVEHTAISVEYVTQRLRRSGADNVVLFLDACREKGGRGGLGIGEEKHQGVITFYSCTANELSWEIEELKHGSFTHALLEGLRLKAEANCATVERLNRYLCHEVPELNKRYGRKVQNPYLKAEPPYKMYFILLEEFASLRDVEPLKLQASVAENRGNLVLAKQLWVRVLAVSRADWDAIDAIGRIARRQGQSPPPKQEPVISSSKSDESLPRGGETQARERDIQKQEQKQQNLERYLQSFSQVVKQEFPLNKQSLRKLRSLQQSLQLTDEEVSQIEQPIVEQKEVEARNREKEARKRQQQEAKKLQQQREKAERLRQQQEIQTRRQQEAITTSTPITRKQILKWLGLGGGGLVTTIVLSQFFKDQPVTLQTIDFKTVTVDDKGQEVKRESGQAQYFTQDLGNGITLDMVSISGGSFMMGTEDEEIERLLKKFNWEYFRREKPQREVTVKPFFLGKYQVTQAQWKAIASLPKVNRDLESNPSYFKGDDLPVEKVSWEDAVEFCQRLSKQTGQEYRLPSEAEWEYACRAGTTTPFHFGETITGDLANYYASSTYANEPKGEHRGKTTPVGSFPPNAFGLYDMHGNIWEWCKDNYHDSYEGAPTDGSAWISGGSTIGVVRGGSWFVNPPYCRSACRFFNTRANRNSFIGFRVACVVPRTT